MKRLLVPVLLGAMLLSACNGETVQKQTRAGSTTATVQKQPSTSSTTEKITVKASSETTSTTEVSSETETTEEESKEESIDKRFEKDINMDGTKEIIDIAFGKEKSSFNISVNNNGKKFTYEGYGCVITDELYFADLDDGDEYVEFYILDEGLSYDPTTYVFRLTGEGIKQIMELDGYLTGYDGKGKMYTEFSRTADKHKQLLAYYELDKGVVYASKEDLYGKSLEYDITLVIHKEPLESTARNSRSIFDPEDEQLKIWAKSSDASVRITEPGEKLKILDIDNSNAKEYGKIRNIPIKVETTDGVQGWIGWLNGGD
jgi:hypothetical protein